MRPRRIAYLLTAAPVRCAAGAGRYTVLHWPDSGEVAEWLKALAC